MRRYDIFFKCHLQKNTVERFIQEGRKNYEVTKIRRQIPIYLLNPLKTMYFQGFSPV